MKTKWLLRISVLALIPMAFSVIILSMISMEWLFNKTGEFAQLFLTGSFNRPFTTVVFGLSLVSISIVATTILFLSKYASKIDKLEEEINTYYTKARKFEMAMNKIDSPDDNNFIVNALNAYWHDANTQLQRKDLGDIERHNLEYQLTQSKKLLNKKL